MRTARIPPRREPGAPVATTIVLADLLPGTHSYADTDRDVVPILIVDTGTTELRFAVPAYRVTLDDVHIVDRLLDAVVAYRTALISHLD